MESTQPDETVIVDTTEKAEVETETTNEPKVEVAPEIVNDWSFFSKFYTVVCGILILVASMFSFFNRRTARATHSSTHAIGVNTVAAAASSWAEEEPISSGMTVAPHWDVDFDSVPESAPADGLGSYNKWQVVKTVRCLGLVCPSPPPFFCSSPF